MVRRDLTSSHIAIDSDQIESLPVESINQILALQAGIIQGAGGELHIRGGRSNEIAYTVNGVSIINPFDNSRSVDVATNAIKELSVISGTFNAEYGNAVDFNPGLDWTQYHADPRYQPVHKLNRASVYTFLSGGTLNDHFYQRTNTLGAKLDFTSQINNNNELKFGVQYRNHTLDYETFSIKRDTIRYLIPTILGTNTSEHDYYTKKPTEFSIYLQDKIEFPSLILNAGLRYDYFNANSKYSSNILYPTPNNPNLPTSVDKNSLLTDAQPKHQLSPRLGISFPITSRGMIHISYGHFFQMPPFTYLYANPNFKYSFAVGTPVYGNADLNPEKTITYEIGLQQQILDDIAFTLTGFLNMGSDPYPKCDCFCWQN